ncbi:hypothetical protein RN001_004022 [Aquatica leii]|uniref:Uncharacterized protein n=1 Tax=Aquatica leii TaxID=1421715 RepID=A0AAN7PRR9_9COLE|nr:hypothetical protein RN001_004022 [Aquatica leii]
MVKINLQIKANLEFLEELYTSHPNFSFYFKIRCLNCGEASDKWHDVSELEKFGSENKHSESNFVAKCKLCGRENSLSIVKDSNGKFSNKHRNKFQTIVTFDCRGIEPIDFDPNSGWVAKVEDTGKLYHDIDLSEKEWVEYDSDIKQSIGIYDFEFQFVKAK